MSKNKTTSTLSQAILVFMLSTMAVAAFAEELRIGVIAKFCGLIVNKTLVATWFNKHSYQRTES
jgi:hypothetical protein